MTEDKNAREKHDREKLSVHGSFEDVIRITVTPDKSSEIRKAIIECLKKDVGFDPASPFLRTSFIWLEKNVAGFKREEIVAALIDMKGVEVVDSMAGTINIPNSYFK
jgi:hypothetical protein